MAPIMLYSSPNSRGVLAEWFAKEIGVPHEVKIVNHKAGETLEPWFLKINPFHKVPTIEDGDYTLFESGAILLYLQQKYAGPVTVEELGHINQWILWANSTLMESIPYTGEEGLKALLSELEGVLEGADFLVGKRFTAADVAVASFLLYLPKQIENLKLSEWKNMWRYLNGIASREACPYKDRIQAAGQSAVVDTSSGVPGTEA